MADDSYWRDAKVRALPAALVALVGSATVWLLDAWLTERSMSISWLVIMFLIYFLSGVLTPWKREPRDDA